MQEIFSATAVVLRARGEMRPEFLGTCFSFRKRTHFLTAAHCIGSLPPEDLFIGSPVANSGHPIQVQAVTRHPQADLAVLEVQPAGMTAVRPFHILSTNYGYGTDFGAVGFPEDSTVEGGLKPTGRFFKGSLQRFWHHSSHLGYEYSAGELSLGALAGLSGGPVFALPQGIHMIGVVAENHESTTYLRTVEEIQDENHFYTDKTRSVIQYGVCVLLRPLETWLNTAVGPEF